ncbi:glycosyltransferase 61 family protein [Escherichia coli]|uniref:glycosyltransferase 61 family protein n=1 Tax=Escherichia coli TaxID=562 RepID=UPI001C703C60|nr:glycosyltransferase 61 family protein [Escherichia coli]MBW9535031.1 glycosyltransferase family 61 protein [Escherichia coli]
MIFSKETDFNVSMSPYFISKNGMFVGGPKNKTHNSRIMRKDKKYIDEPLSSSSENNDPKVIKGNYLFAGPLYSHFGHILTESIHRLYGYNKDSFDGVIFCCASFATPGINRTEIPNFLTDILKSFGIPKEKCFLVKETTYFEHVTYFEPGSNLQCGVEDWYLNELKNINLPFEHKEPQDTSSFEKLYLGRSHIIDNGSVMGESYITSLLISNGFKYFAPERYSISNQVEILSNAKEIVFIEGSSIYASELISTWNSKVMMIPRRNFDSFFKPHIDSKTSYSVLGDMRSITRFPNHEGLVKPNSPSMFNNIVSLFDDLRINSLINPNQTLSLEEYKEHFVLDVLRYSKGNKALADNILREFHK